MKELRDAPSLPPSLLAELPQRLFKSAEAFYYAGILCSLEFDAESIEQGNFRHVPWAAEAAISSGHRINYLGAPPIVNLALAIELYIKLLQFMATKERKREHNLLRLCIRLYETAPEVVTVVIRNHHAANDCEMFLSELKPIAKDFEQWRYAHEHSLLATSVDSLLQLANAFRRTIRELHPQLRSPFRDAHLSNA